MTDQQEQTWVYSINKLSSENVFLIIFQVLIAGTFKGMEIRPGSFGKASPAYDVQVNIISAQVSLIILIQLMYFIVSECDF